MNLSSKQPESHTHKKTTLERLNAGSTILAQKNALGSDQQRIPYCYIVCSGRNQRYPCYCFASSGSGSGSGSGNFKAIGDARTWESISLALSVLHSASIKLSPTNRAKFLFEQSLEVVEPVVQCLGFLIKIGVPVIDGINRKIIVVEQPTAHIFPQSTTGHMGRSSTAQIVSCRPRIVFRNPKKPPPQPALLHPTSSWMGRRIIRSSLI